MGVFGFTNPKGNDPKDDSKAPWHIPAVDEAISKPAGAKSKPSAEDKGFYFDPSGLERAAAAVKELDSSKNAKLAYDISKEQEKTKQLEMNARSKQYEAMSDEKRSELADKQVECQRKQLQHSTNRTSRRLNMRIR